MSQQSLPTANEGSSNRASNPRASLAKPSAFQSFLNFFLTGPDAEPLTDEAEIQRRYRRNRISVFLSITLGYAMYYVVRQGYSVVKKPMLDAGVFTAFEMGKIGSVFFFTYMIGKCLNGFLADRLNIKRFLALGLLGSSAILVTMGFCSSFYLFAVLWGLCGWFQTFGAAPCIVSLNQWFSNKERGTYYGVWFSAHNIGTGLTYIFTAVIVASYGWRMGFFAPGVLGISAAVLLYLFMYDRPQVYGLPPVSVYKGEQTQADYNKVKTKPVFKAQMGVLLRPAIWILGLSSAACYIGRYAIESWGVLFLTETKGYSLTKASAIISISQFAGIAGAISCGWISDKFFHHKRSLPCMLFGIVFVASTAMFVYMPKGHPWADYVSMILFGYTVYALVTYLGGLMAVDICSKKATGAAMGVIGLFSYAGASLQEIVGGYFLNSHKTVIDGKTIYDFTTVGHFWVIATVFALVLPLFVWNAKQED